jgi:hypothetical protein
MKIFVAGATGVVGRRLVPCSSSVARWFGTTTRPGRRTPCVPPQHVQW